MTAEVAGAGGSSPPAAGESGPPAAGESGPPATLEVPPEPTALRDSIRQEVLGGADWQERFGPGLGVGEVLWEHWSPVLAQAGTTRSAFEAAVRAYRRELWFWVLGERRWEQAASGLAGRLLRRTADARVGQ